MTKGGGGGFKNPKELSDIICGGLKNQKKTAI